MLKWMLAPAVPKVTLATGQEGVCTEFQPEALKRSRDTLVIFPSHHLVEQQ